MKRKAVFLLFTEFPYLYIFFSIEVYYIQCYGIFYLRVPTISFWSDCWYVISLLFLLNLI